MAIFMLTLLSKYVILCEAGAAEPPRGAMRAMGGGGGRAIITMIVLWQAKINKKMKNYI
jgi:hypothetical protein